MSSSAAPSAATTLSSSTACAVSHNKTEGWRQHRDRGKLQRKRLVPPRSVPAETSNLTLCLQSPVRKARGSPGLSPVVRLPDLRYLLTATSEAGIPPIGAPESPARVVVQGPAGIAQRRAERALDDDSCGLQDLGGRRDGWFCSVREWHVATAPS